MKLSLRLISSLVFSILCGYLIVASISARRKKRFARDMARRGEIPDGKLQRPSSPFCNPILSTRLPASWSGLTTPASGRVAGLRPERQVLAVSAKLDHQVRSSSPVAESQIANQGMAVRDPA